MIRDRSGTVNDVYLSNVIGTSYTYGQTYSVNGRTVVNGNGVVYDYNGNQIGYMRPDGAGRYVYATLAGTGNSTSSTTIANSVAGFGLLTGMGSRWKRSDWGPTSPTTISSPTTLTASS